MKDLKDLTEKEFKKLKQCDLLNSIYPDAPEKYTDIKGEPLDLNYYQILI